MTRDSGTVIEIINKAKNSGEEVCVFGTGLIARKVSQKFLKLLGLQIDFFCDNDDSRWGKEILNQIHCISPLELYKKKDHLLCVVMIGGKYYEEVLKQLKIIGIKDVITYDDICGLDCIVDDFWELKETEAEAGCLKKRKDISGALQLTKQRIAVYTCITGAYDEVLEPGVVEENCDYYLISDSRPQSEGIYRWIDIKDVLPPCDLDMARKNRYCKINAHKIFPQYKYSLYVDGNVRIIRKIGHYVGSLGKTGIAIHRHPYQDCIYEEAMRLAVAEYAKPEMLREQVREYWAAGMPRNYGMYECRMLTREHNHPICKYIMEQWWEEVRTKTYRDQISLPYILWKNGFAYDSIGIMGEESLHNEDFEVINHHHGGRKDYKIYV